MSDFVYWPQAYPSHRFDTLAECRKFMNTGPIPFINFSTIIGVFIVRQSKRTGSYTLIEHRHSDNIAFYKKYVKRYKGKEPADRNSIYV